MSVRNALLGLLAQRPRHGYELHDAFEAVVGGERNWDVKPAQIYTTLTRLEKGGLVTLEGQRQDGGPAKRIYAITPAGQQVLYDWLLTPISAQHQRDEFFLKLMLSLATGVVDPVQIIYAQRASLYQDLHDVTAQRAGSDSQSELAYILLLDHAVMRLEADLHWLDMVEARLDDVRRQPIPEPVSRPRGRPKKEKEVVYE